MAWNQTTGPSKPVAKKNPNILRGLIAGIAVVAIGVAAFFLLSGDKVETKAKTEKKVTQIEEVRPASVVTNAPAASRSPEAPADDGVPKTWQGQPVVRHTCITNNTLVFEKFYTADGKVHGYYHDERAKALPTGADQVLAIMTGHDDGVGAPPLPHIENFGRQFEQALKQEIVINENDSPEVKEVKERVIAARQELADLMAEGQSADEVLDNWKRMQEDNATVRLEAVRKVRELLDSGDRSGAQALCDSYNKVLEKSGIMKIEIPSEEDSRNSTRKNSK